jgi:NDP-sugar pyrophosphorylase family protein
VVKVDDDSNVTAFVEKPKPDKLAGQTINTINAGIYILEPQILDLIPKSENRSFEYDVFPEILQRKLPFSAYTLQKEYWRDIGTCKSYLESHLDFIGGKIKGFEATAAASSDVATSAEVDRHSILGAGCIVKPGAQVTNSVLGAGVTLEEKAVVDGSVIWPHTRVSSAAEIHGAIIGRGAHIGRNAIVGEGSVLGDKASLPDYSRV